MNLIDCENCSVQDANKIYLKEIDFTLKDGDAYLVTGANGGGKAAFVKALSGRLKFVPNEVSCRQDGKTRNFSSYFSLFENSVALVSLEEAAALIEEERERDESEYMNKDDPGRSGRQYIAEVLGGDCKKGAPLPDVAWTLENNEYVKLCGVEKILDRGLRYMSTGEIRRTLLCRALLSGAKLLILSDPFAGLDASSRKILLDFFDALVQKKSSAGKESENLPSVILCMERWHEIPSAINKVLEFSDGKISFDGPRDEYEKRMKEKKLADEEKLKKEKETFLLELDRIRKESQSLTEEINCDPVPDELIKFEDVNVGWGDHHVLVNLNWLVERGKHWFIRGPNGSGKTTLLELITGDNMQVFREKVFLFGKRRGSGETIWDIKKQLGIVSYRLHVEYRMVGGTELQDVIVSGFYDSIGLYQQASDFERATARAWLKLAGFAGRESESFSSLSYGEQRAILILRAAVKMPRLLILDEPCHGLDENYRDKILELLKRVAATGTTTLLHVTHDPSERLECEKNILELCPGENPMYKIICEE